MTFTSHGHHIWGTVTSDEPTQVSRARCGGPNLCAKCAREQAAHLEKNMKEEAMPVSGQLQNEASISGTGALLVNELKDILGNIPGNAALTITQTRETGQRGGESWRIVAKWVNPQGTRVQPIGTSHRQLNDESLQSRMEIR